MAEVEEVKEVKAKAELKFATGGGNYGSVVELIAGTSAKNKTLRMAGLTSDVNIFTLNLDNISQCVVPTNNRDDLEMQFADKEKPDKHTDSLVQMTLHFPMGEDDDDKTKAEVLHKSILDSGVINSVTGQIIAEFSKEQGNFTTPRGKYSIQMTAQYFHMQGAQYAYKIKYEDINSLFLLQKPDGGRMSFVISLEKPIRQGSQIYHHLVLETHKLELVMSVNLTQEEIDENYEGELQPEMTLPTSSMIAKLFKVLSKKRVFIPKQYKSARDAFCVRCSVKANDGLLYPLAKSFIFINKPTIIIPFENINFVEFLRYVPAANSATRNFDLMVSVKDSGAEKGVEYNFISIDRSEYNSLFEYMNSKEINVRNPQAAGAADGKKQAGTFAGMDGGDDDDEGDSEDDGDYKAGESDSGSGGGGGGGGGSDDDDSDDSGNSDGGSDNGGEEKKKVVKKKRSNKASASDGDKPKRKKSKTEGKSPGKKAEKGEKKKKAPKDKNAPKGARGSYILFSAENRAKVLASNPGMPVTEVAKALGVLWKTVSAEDKAMYDQKAKEDKIRYTNEMQAYNDKKELNAVEVLSD